MGKNVTTEKILDVLKSTSYRNHLRRIHRYYSNVKSEHRYRDAFLEIFNNNYNKQGFHAFAEVDKMDLIILDENDSGKENWVNIQFKYQFTHDMAKYRCERFREVAFWELVDNEKSTSDVAALIARDCIGVEAGEEGGKKKKIPCDVFVLIVQDRHNHPKDNFYLPIGTNEENGVEIKFIADQINLDKKCEKRNIEYDASWRTPTKALLEEILKKINGKSKTAISLRKVVSHFEQKIYGKDLPLTSHFFVMH